jgi:glutamine synthetase
MAALSTARDRRGPERASSQGIALDVDRVSRMSSHPHGGSVHDPRPDFAHLDEGRHYLRADVSGARGVRATCLLCLRWRVARLLDIAGGGWERPGGKLAARKVLTGQSLCGSVFLSYRGHALDYKLPLLRSDEAMSKECTRLLGLMNYKIAGAQSNIGLEQEFFLIPQDAYAKRPDLQQSGRTVLGKFPGRGQEMCDHYMAPLNPNALNCLREIQHECFKMGIPLKTRHREVAPNQYEMAPYFGHVTSQVDQNLLVMQVCEEVAPKHKLKCLLQEKPFAGINGSGKHNNWSIGTKDGVNLLNAKQITEKSGNPEIFPVIMAAIVSAVDKHGDLIRAAIASPGNDFRLGAMEAPPAIISTYLGETLTEFLDAFRSGKPAEYKPQAKFVDTGSEHYVEFEVPTEDRNRTSPFPYGGHRFELRAAGSAQNVSFINTVLNTICAEAFKDFADKIEAGAKPSDVAAEALNAHWKVIFNGNGYDPAWKDEAVARGIWRIDSGVEATAKLGDDKNTALFEKVGVLTKDEMVARRDINWEHYIGLVEIEANTMIDMITQSIIPALKKVGVDTGAIAAGCKKVQDKLSAVHAAEDGLAKATCARELRLEVMVECRKACDEAETICPAEAWPFATYRELLFLDQNQDHQGVTVK